MKMPIMKRIQARGLKGLIKLTQVLKHCKCGNFHVRLMFTYFSILPSYRKFPPHENKTHMTLFRRKEYYRQKLPPCERFHKDTWKESESVQMIWRVCFLESACQKCSRDDQFLFLILLLCCKAICNKTLLSLELWISTLSQFILSIIQQFNSEPHKT